MASLTKAIRFRHLAEQLTPAEFNQFLSKLVQRYGKNIILNSLFSYLAASTNPMKIMNEDDIIEIISNIIRARKNKSSQPQNIHMTQLNPNLIGKVASYLKQRDYVYFSMCCRSILIGCNTPNTLQKINLDLFDMPYSAINLSLYPSVKYIEFESERFENLNFADNNLTNLQHLRLKDLFNHLHTFMNSKHINFDAIQKLDFIIPFHKTNPGCLWEFFSKFKNIQRLELSEQFEIPFTGNETETENLFPNLKVFCSNGSTFASGIINKYSNQLQGLKFNDTEQIVFDQNAKFNQLNELTVVDARQHTIEQILQSAKHLEKVRFSDFAIARKKDVQNLIQTLISSQLLLKYMDVKITTSYNRFEGVFNGMEKGLFEIKKQKKRYFKARVRIECKTEINLNDLMLHISRIKGVLQLSNVRDFMLLCVLHGDKKPEKVTIDKVIGEYRDCESTVNIYPYYYYNNDCMIVVTNVNCKINGYSESWM